MPNLHLCWPTHTPTSGDSPENHTWRSVRGRGGHNISTLNEVCQLTWWDFQKHFLSSIIPERKDHRQILNLTHTAQGRITPTGVSVQTIRHEHGWYFCSIIITLPGIKWHLVAPRPPLLDTHCIAQWCVNNSTQHTSTQSSGLTKQATSQNTNTTFISIDNQNSPDN